MARQSKPRTARGTPASPAPERRRGFISYAHEDHDQFELFQKYLKGALRGFPWVDIHADPSIQPGAPWEAEILKMIDQAHIFILLVSPSFLASDFIWDKELPAMKDRVQKIGALLLPVVLSRCLWKNVCDAIQAVPKDKGQLKPIGDWEAPTHGFVQAHEEIADAIARHFGVPMQSFDWSAK